jgi:hypothetical protein
MIVVLWLTVRLLTRLLVLSDADLGTRDLEILVLRHQLRVLRRKSGRPKFTARDRAPLAAPAGCSPRQRWASSFLVTPQTLLRWHRTLVRRKWSYGKERTPGRPPIDPQIADLILRMARENARWGCVRICGELRKLGIPLHAAVDEGHLVREAGPAGSRSRCFHQIWCGSAPAQRSRTRRRTSPGGCRRGVAAATRAGHWSQRAMEALAEDGGDDDAAITAGD